jgi:hypothetical protein
MSQSDDRLLLAVAVHLFVAAYVRDGFGQGQTARQDLSPRHQHNLKSIEQCHGSASKKRQKCGAALALPTAVKRVGCRHGRRPVPEEMPPGISEAWKKADRRSPRPAAPSADKVF